MTQEEKDLLLKDLCARLPYGVIVNDRNGIHKLTQGNTEFADLFSGKCNIKPYLRPMSSMTEKEKKEFIDATDGELRYSEVFNNIKPLYENEDYFASFVSYLKAIDWLNKKMFDYRGWIEKDLALPAPEGMYKEE